MNDFISYVVRNLVDRPEEVSVHVFDGQRSSIVEIQVHIDDVAKLIGRQGRTIQALRTLSTVVATRLGRRVRLEVVS